MNRLVPDLSMRLNEIRYLLTFLTKADKAALIFSGLMLLSIFLPWLSHPGLLTLTGLMSGGGIPSLLAIYTMHKSFQVADYHQKSFRENSLSSLPIRLRRVSMSYLLVGFICTLFTIITLIYFLSQQGTFALLDIRAGFYLTLCCGFGIFCCGLERFRP